MKTLVYGFNTDFRRYREWIEQKFNVCGYYDADKSRIPEKDGIDLESNPEDVHKFDIVLVAADPVSIVGDLIYTYHVPFEKIRVLYYELLKDNKALITYFGSYSEDAALFFLINKIGKEIGNIKYLEIGTNDPVRANNTFAFYQAGARGVLVDPLPAVGRLVSMIRPEDKFINAAVSDLSDEKGIEFFACKSSTVSSIVENHHEKWNIT